MAGEGFEKVTSNSWAKVIKHFREKVGGHYWLWDDLCEDGVERLVIEHDGDTDSGSNDIECSGSDAGSDAEYGDDEYSVDDWLAHKKGPSFSHNQLFKSHHICKQSSVLAFLNECIKKKHWSWLCNEVELVLEYGWSVFFNFSSNLASCFHNKMLQDMCILLTLWLAYLYAVKMWIFSCRWVGCTLCCHVQYYVNIRWKHCRLTQSRCQHFRIWKVPYIGHFSSTANICTENIRQGKFSETGNACENFLQPNFYR